MNIAVFLLFFFINASISYSQKLEYEYSFDRYISDSLMNNNPYGVYLTHQEFLYGTPSISRQYEIRERSPEGQMSFLRRQPKVLRVLDIESNKMKRYYGVFWCAFDGHDMILMKDFVLYQLEYTGRFNVCTSERWKRTFFTPPSYATRTPSYRYYKEEKKVTSKIVDFKTNEWYTFNKRGMKKILSDNNPLLYEKFISEKRKKTKLGLYLKRLNGIKVAGW